MKIPVYRALARRVAQIHATDWGKRELNGRTKELVLRNMVDELDEFCHHHLDDSEWGANRATVDMVRSHSNMVWVDAVVNHEGEGVDVVMRIYASLTSDFGLEVEAPTTALEQVAADHFASVLKEEVDATETLTGETR